MEDKVPIVEMKGIYKTFGAVRALVDVNLRLHKNEILGLVGDNAAGKSTLMKILTGAYTADEGEILMDDQKVHIVSPHQSREMGIEMVYQDFALCGNLDVSTNIFLGRWPRKGPFVSVRKMDSDSQHILGRLKVDIASVKLKVESLSGGRQQSVAIGRAISFNPRVLILDEPTANLSVSATEKVLDLMRELKDQGVSMIIISHRLQDIFAVGDRVMVLKRGHLVGERAIKETTESDVLSMIVHGDAYEASRKD
jgi:simple sugar transport system ATP-binding protein